jgi:hypothetical protein
MISSFNCTTERNPCLLPTVSKVFLGCYQYKEDTKTYTDTALPNANFVCLDIDSAKFLYFGAKKLTKFELVLSPLKDTVRWALQPDSSVGAYDTISFVYERKLKFYSNACGYGYEFSLSEILSTRANIDSVSIANKDVTTKSGVENVKIYF